MPASYRHSRGPHRAPDLLLKDLKKQLKEEDVAPLRVDLVRGRASVVAQPVKNLPANAGDSGSIPGWGSRTRLSN